MALSCLYNIHHLAHGSNSRFTAVSICILTTNIVIHAPLGISALLFYSSSTFVFVTSSTERQVFLATWKDIPNDNESQFQMKDCHINSGNGGCESNLWKTAVEACSLSICEIACQHWPSQTQIIANKENCIWWQVLNYSPYLFICDHLVLHKHKGQLNWKRIPNDSSMEISSHRFRYFTSENERISHPSGTQQQERSWRKKSFQNLEIYLCCTDKFEWMIRAHKI